MTATKTPKKDILNAGLLSDFGSAAPDLGGKEPFWWLAPEALSKGLNDVQVVYKRDYDSLAAELARVRGENEAMQDEIQSIAAVIGRTGDWHDLAGDVKRKLAERKPGWVAVPMEALRVIESAKTLAPLLNEGWDDDDPDEHQAAGNKACDELVEAVRFLLTAAEGDKGGAG